MSEQQNKVGEEESEKRGCTNQGRREQTGRVSWRKAEESGGQRREN